MNSPMKCGLILINLEELEEFQRGHGMEAAGAIMREVSRTLKDMMRKAGSSKLVGSNMQGAGESFTLKRDDMPKLRETLQKSVRQLSDFDKLKDHIEMTVTAEGLRIELMESEAGTFFESGNPVPTPNGREFLIALAQQLGQLPNKISIEGHTDAKPFTSGRNYGNWELSADRAHAARRLMQDNGVNANQVLQIRGYADQRLRKPDSPGDPSNRRISVIVQYLVKDVEESKGVEESKPAEASGKNEHAEAPAKTKH